MVLIGVVISDLMNDAYPICGSLTSDRSELSTLCEKFGSDGTLVGSKGRIQEVTGA